VAILLLQVMCSCSLLANRVATFARCSSVSGVWNHAQP
jgi:hypothetical protein